MNWNEKEEFSRERREKKKQKCLRGVNNLNEKERDLSNIYYLQI